MEDTRAGLGGGCAEVCVEEEEGESDDDEREEDVCSGTVAGRRYGWWVHSVRPSVRLLNEREGGKTSQSSPADAGAMVCSIYKYPPRSPHVASVPVLKRSHCGSWDAIRDIVVQAFFFEEEARDKHSFNSSGPRVSAKECGPRRDTATVTGGLALEHGKR